MTRGGPRPGAGQPRGTRSPHAARVAIQVRCTEADRDRYRAAAEMDGVELSEQVRDLLDAWAERVEKRDQVRRDTCRCGHARSRHSLNHGCLECTRAGDCGKFVAEEGT